MAGCVGRAVVGPGGFAFDDGPVNREFTRIRIRGWLETHVDWWHFDLSSFTHAMPAAGLTARTAVRDVMSLAVAMRGGKADAVLAWFE